ncbi:MAG: hypothetical protein IPI66_13035 [Chitinophagaceae bacterium]|nr:hypothetical protein [Chitinophagaceae bacterium]
MRNKTLRKIHFYFSSLLLFLLHLPFVFAKSRPTHEPKPLPLKIHNNSPMDPMAKSTLVKNDNLFLRCMTASG